MKDVFQDRIAEKQSPDKGELVIVRGLPGSGKTTFGKVLANAFGIQIEHDMYFSRSGKYVDFTSPDEFFRATRWALNTAQIVLNQGKRAVVSNVFPKIKSIKDYVKYAKLNGHSIDIITLTSNYGSVHDIPPEHLDSMYDTFRDHNEIIEAYK